MPYEIVYLILFKLIVLDHSILRFYEPRMLFCELFFYRNGLIFIFTLAVFLPNL
jgi:hypothetical protein